MLNFGIIMFMTDYSMQPVEVAVAAEEREFESLWVPETLTFRSCARVHGREGGPLPKEYWHAHDPFVVLGAAAAVTKKIKLGTGICLVVERDPITLAKQVASLDLISNGRVLFGIGGGWNAEEMENHGVNFKRRWKIVREKILAMREIWTKDEAEFHGAVVNFDKLWSYPKPVQPGGPPVIMGAHTPKAFERIAEYCDGWLPADHGSEYNWAADIKQLREAEKRFGRKNLSLSMTSAPANESMIRKLADFGFERLIFHVPSASRDTVLPLMDNWASIAARVR